MRSYKPVEPHSASSLGSSCPRFAFIENGVCGRRIVFFRSTLADSMRSLHGTLAARGENRLTRKRGQSPYFAHEEVPSNQGAPGAKCGDCPKFSRCGPFNHGLLADHP